MITMEALYTRAEYELLPEEFPAELIEGMLVKQATPRYGHQHVGARIRYALLKLLGPELVPDTPAGVGIDDHNVFAPDIVVLRERPPVEDWDVGIPILAVEVLSSSTEKRDRHVKTVRMLEAGVEEVWLIDWRREAVELHTSSWHRRFTGDERAESGAVEGFALVPKVLFGE